MLVEVEKMIREVIMENVYDFDRENDEHYKDENKTVLHP